MLGRLFIAAVFLFALPALHAVEDDSRLAVNHLRSIGQAMMIYAAENKGYFPERLSAVVKYVSPETFLSGRRRQAVDPKTMSAEKLAEWIDRDCDFAYVVPPMTKLAKLQPAHATPTVMERTTGSVVAVLYADGHVTEIGQTTQPTARTPMAAAMATTLPAGDLSQKLVGAWKIAFQNVICVYRFNADGTFTLDADIAPGQPPAHSSGNWRVEGRKLTIHNSASDSPVSIVGENEETEILGLSATQLVLANKDNKGKEERLLFSRELQAPAPIAIDKNKLAGTWRGFTTLVLGPNGFAALDSGGQGALKGTWVAEGNELDLQLAYPRQEIGGAEERMLRLSIDYLDDTTLVITGNVRGQQAGTIILGRQK